MITATALASILCLTGCGKTAAPADVAADADLAVEVETGESADVAARAITLNVLDDKYRTTYV